MNYRIRQAEKKLRDYAQYFKVILVTGARQVGKSTLLQHLFPQTKAVVLDPVQDLYGAREDPDLFLNNFGTPLILDEVQYIPELLPALKRRVDQSEEPGQYFLTGSQNLSVLRSIAESLAGRVGIFHLEGMSLAEMQGNGDKSVWLANYLKEPEDFQEKALKISTESGELTRILWRGALPGLLDKPDTIVPDYFRSYVQTYIERDVRLLEDIRDLSLFSRFMGLTGALTAQEINASQLGRDIGVNPKTARKWLDLLTNSYQWLETYPYHGNSIKRISGKRKGYLRDTGLACHLQRISSPDALAVNPLLGPFFETWVTNEIFRSSGSLAVPPQLYHWRTSGGAEVDLVLERDGRFYPIEVKCKANLNKNDLRGIKSFRETYTQMNIAPALLIYAGSESYRMDAQTLALPWNFHFS